MQLSLINKISSLLASPLIRNTLKLSSSNIILYLLPVFVTPILSRQYTPNFFGEWGVFSSTFVLISVVMFLSYDYVIIQAKESEIGNVLIINLTIGLLFLLLTYSVFSLGKNIGISFFADFRYLNLLCLYLFLNTFQVILQNYLNRYRFYTILSYSNIIIGISQAVLRIFFGLYIVLAANGLISGTVYAHFIGIIFLLIYFLRIIRNKRVELQPLPKIFNTVSKYKNFPLYDAPATLLTFAASNLTIIILSLYFTKAQIGGYSMMIQLMILPISFIGSAMGKVYYQQLSSDTSFSGAKEITRSIIKFLLYLSIIPSLFIILGGDYLLVKFLGKEWETVSMIAICLCIWSIPTILTEPLKYIFKYLNKQKLQLYIIGLYFIIAIISLLLTCSLGYSLKNVLIVYSYSCAIVRFFLFFAIIKLTHIPFNSLPKTAIYSVGFTISLIIIRCILL